MGGRPQGRHGRATPLEGLPVDLTQLCPGLRRDLERECEKEKRTWSREPGARGGVDNAARHLLAFCRSCLGRVTVGTSRPSLGLSFLLCTWNDGCRDGKLLRGREPPRLWWAPQSMLLERRDSVALVGRRCEAPPARPRRGWGRKEPLRGRIHEADACPGRRGLPDGDGSAAQSLPSVCRLQTMGLTPKEARTPEGLMGPWRAAGRASQVNCPPAPPFSLEAQRAPGGGQTASVVSDSLLPPWTVPPGSPVLHHLPEFAQTHVH